jgi:hypothetical protein
VTYIKERAEQEKEYAYVRGLAGRRLHCADIVDRRRVADHQSVADFALRPDIVHRTLDDPKTPQRR